MKWESEFTDQQFKVYFKNQLESYLGKAARTAIILCPNPDVLKHLVGKTPHRYICVGKSIQHPRVRVCNTLQEAAEEDGIGAICITSTKSSEIHMAARAVRQVEKLSDVRIFYLARGSDAYPVLQQFDALQRQEDHVFLTSDFDDGMFEDIYRYSITKVKPKCQARDAHDLFQCLKNIRSVDGDIVEFGSYQGHSGLIMAEFVSRLGLDKKVFLCDTFDGFPKENLGIDKFWNNTHTRANYRGVDALFEPYDFVTLIKGDFTKTADTIPSDKFCFAMLDCDSYRGTKFAAEFVWSKLATGGIIACEDYGHHILLGARLAIDEFCEEYSGLVSLFSFFSGFRIIVKTS